MYCSLDDLLERIPEETLIQITDDDGAGAIDQGKVAAAIARAGNEIDAWCGGRYRTPFAPVPAIISEIAADLAVYYLYARRQEIIPEARTDRYRGNLAMLKEIAHGLITLPGSATAEEPTGTMAVAAPGRLFSAEDLERY